MDRLDGEAAVEATRRRAERAVADGVVAPSHYRLGPGGLTFSSLGLGTYLGRPDAATDHAVEEAVRVCLASRRVNVIDTAINYRYQRAERSVGRALAGLVASGRVTRDEVFVATKAGYLAPDGESPLPPEEYLRTELLDPGILDPADVVDGSHAMSPRYLEDQIERSRRNLGLATVDLLYLHNAADAQLPSLGPERFFGRLGAAFEVLERARDAGKVRAFGLATWDCIRVPPSDPRHLSLEAAVAIARRVGGDDHGFRFVQGPFNRAFPEAAVAATQAVDGSRVPAFEAARRLGLGVFTSVPLLQGKFAGPGAGDGGLSRAQAALQLARSAPGVLAALVGQKSPAHLAENLEVAGRDPWNAADVLRRLT